MKNLSFKRLSPLIAAFVITISTLISSVTTYATDGKYDEDFFSGNDIVIYNPADTGCGTGASGSEVTQLSGSDNRQKIWNYLTTRGLSPQQAAGVMGNIQSESGGTWSPTIQEFSQSFGNGGYGLVQWTGGRRDNLVASLNKNIPDVMAQYYNSAYSTQGESYTDQSAGFIPKNASTGVPMATTANDQMLLAELNFLYDESTNRIVSSTAVAKGLATSGETEWDALQKQTSTDGASDLWVYSFEIPADIDTTAAARRTNGEAIYQLYGVGGSQATCVNNDSKQQLAQQIISNPNITFDPTSDGQIQQKIINDVASGANNGNNWPCGVNIMILKIILALGKDHKIRINDMNRACSSASSGGFDSDYHHNGNGSAVDLGAIDGLPSYSPAGAQLIISILAPLMVPGDGVGQSECGLGLTLPKGTVTFPDTCNHLHVNVTMSQDPALQCKNPISGDTCKNVAP